MHEWSGRICSQSGKALRSTIFFPLKDPAGYHLSSIRTSAHAPPPPSHFISCPPSAPTPFAPQVQQALQGCASPPSHAVLVLAKQSHGSRVGLSAGGSGTRRIYPHAPPTRHVSAAAPHLPTSTPRAFCNLLQSMVFSNKHRPTGVCNRCLADIGHAPDCTRAGSMHTATIHSLRLIPCPGVVLQLLHL